MRPPQLAKLIANFLGLIDVPMGLRLMLINAFGKLDPQEKTYIPESEHYKVIRVARLWMLIYAATIVVAVIMHSWLPLLLIGTPRFYGAWHHMMTGIKDLFVLN